MYSEVEYVHFQFLELIVESVLTFYSTVNNRNIPIEYEDLTRGGASSNDVSRSWEWFQGG